MLDTVVGTLDEVSLTLGVVGLHFRACERRGASRLVLARRIQHASSRPGKVTAQASQKRVREKKKSMLANWRRNALGAMALVATALAVLLAPAYAKVSGVGGVLPRMGGVDSKQGWRHG